MGGECPTSAVLAYCGVPWRTVTVVTGRARTANFQYAPSRWRAKGPLFQCTLAAHNLICIILSRRRISPAKPRRRRTGILGAPFYIGQLYGTRRAVRTDCRNASPAAKRDGIITALGTNFIFITYNFEADTRGAAVACARFTFVLIINFIRHFAKFANVPTISLQV